MRHTNPASSPHHHTAAHPQIPSNTAPHLRQLLCVHGCCLQGQDSQVLKDQQWFSLWAVRNHQPHQTRGQPLGASTKFEEGKGKRWGGGRAEWRSERGRANGLLGEGAVKAAAAPYCLACASQQAQCDTPVAANTMCLLAHLVCLHSKEALSCACERCEG